MSKYIIAARMARTPFATLATVEYIMNDVGERYLDDRPLLVYLKSALCVRALRRFVEREHPVENADLIVEEIVRLLDGREPTSGVLWSDISNITCYAIQMPATDREERLFKVFFFGMVVVEVGADLG